MCVTAAGPSGSTTLPIGAKYSCWASITRSAVLSIVDLTLARPNCALACYHADRWPPRRRSRDRLPAGRVTMLDLLITGGLLIDGTGNPGYYGAVGVEGERLRLFRGTLDGVAAARRLDATGQIVCPGFIDMHAHSGL